MTRTLLRYDSRNRNPAHSRSRLTTLTAALAAALLLAATPAPEALACPEPAATTASADTQTVVQPPAAPVAAGDAESPSLNRALIARVVENRVPSVTEGPFEADGERLYVFLEVDNPGHDPVVYTVSWHHIDTDRRFSQTIEAGHSPRWRTWVYHRMSESRVGDWEVEVVAPNGEVQAELTFSVAPTSEPQPSPEHEAPATDASPDV